MLVVYRRGLHALYRHSTALVCRSIEAGLRPSSTAASPAVSTRNFSSSPTSGGQGDNPIAKKSVPALQKDLNTAHDAVALVAAPPQPAAETGLPWLNIKASILGPRDRRVELPGRVGVSLQTASGRAEKQVLSPLPPHTSSLRFMEDIDTNYQSQAKAISCVQMNVEDNIELSDTLLECKAQECPRLLQKDMRTVFPSRPDPEMALTAVTLAQRTTNDMAAWSEHVEEEREILLEQFVEAARKICNSLSTEGYWADFLDPSSGRPYYEPYTSATMFETDERYRHLGLTIEDLGCCKVVSHRLFGTHVFVGVIFTDAPVGSVALQEVLNYQNAQALATDIDDGDQ